MSKKRKTHAGPHKYQRIKWKSRSTSEPYIVFKCMLAGCPHYVAKDVVIGNETTCWRCGSTFQMALPHTYMAKPHCLACTKGRKGDVDVSDVLTNLDKILGGI